MNHYAPFRTGRSEPNVVLWVEGREKTRPASQADGLEVLEPSGGRTPIDELLGEAESGEESDESGSRDGRISLR